jgi:hypothetical protein
VFGGRVGRLYDRLVPHTMIVTRTWAAAASCGLIGAAVGYVIHTVMSPGLAAGVVVLCLTYVSSFAVVLLQAALLMRTAVHETGGAVAINFDSGREFLWFDATAIVSVLAYFLAVAIPWEIAASGRLSLVACGAACGVTSILVRTLPATRATQRVAAGGS